MWAVNAPAPAHAPACGRPGSSYACGGREAPTSHAEHGAGREDAHTPGQRAARARAYIHANTHAL